jgi:hypothetical protein
LVKKRRERWGQFGEGFHDAKRGARAVRQVIAEVRKEIADVPAEKLDPFGAYQLVADRKAAEALAAAGAGAQKQIEAAAKAEAEAKITRRVCIFGTPEWEAWEKASLAHLDDGTLPDPGPEPPGGPNSSMEERTIFYDEHGRRVERPDAPEAPPAAAPEPDPAQALHDALAVDGVAMEVADLLALESRAVERNSQKMREDAVEWRGSLVARLGEVGTLRRAAHESVRALWQARLLTGSLLGEAQGLGFLTREEMVA